MPTPQPEESILGEPRTLTSDAVAAAAGVPLGEARRLWRALGFADAGGAPAFTTADREALRLIVDTVRSHDLDFETAVRLTRAVGHTMARLADWQVATLSEQVEAGSPPGVPPDPREAVALTADVAPAFERLVLYAWRRHLAAAVGRIAHLDADDDLLTAVYAVGFADLVSFTRLSNGLDDSSLAELVEAFESRCADIIAAQGGRLIKTLGDSVLFVCERAEDSVDIAAQIVDCVGSDPALPDVRVGIATGTVIMRLGDVFGTPVNLAARMTALARRNRVICDRATARLLPEDRYETRPLTARPAAGFGLVEPMAVRRRSL